MPKVITSTELQKQTREAIDYARIERDPVIIETYGRPMAVILSFEEYESYVEYKASRERRAAQFTILRETADKNAAYNQLTEEEAIQLVEEARQEIANSR